MGKGAYTACFLVDTWLLVAILKVFFREEIMRSRLDQSVELWYQQ